MIINYKIEGEKAERLNQSTKNGKINVSKKVFN
jgi:hypothetical protein